MESNVSHACILYMQNEVEVCGAYETVSLTCTLLMTVSDVLANRCSNTCILVLHTDYCT